MPQKRNRTSTPRPKSSSQIAQPAKKAKTSFGAVTSISTAPVSIGNSVRGSQSRVINTQDGATVIGRDYAFLVAPTASGVTGWTLVGGMPLTPAVLPSSILRNYTQMYNMFRVNAVNIHYITSSATSQAGDVMFYYERDRQGPMIDWTNSSFLPLVLSDPNTIIGPQWTNHTLTINPTSNYKRTDYGMNPDLNEESCGSVFLFSKTNTSNSPGFIMVDYNITFKELCVNPRAGILPVARGQWSNICLGYNATAVTTSTTVGLPVTGLDLSGGSTAMVSGAAAGDVYKCTLDVTNSLIINGGWTNCTTANLIAYYDSGTAVATTIDDGFTFYAVWTGTTLLFFPTLESAKVGILTGMLYFGVSATVTFKLITWISLVGSTTSRLQAAY